MAGSKGRDDRRVSESPDQRTQAERDRDRILYTTAFRRLAGITQVVAPSERQVLHNRLTHTLEVAQIARRLAEKLLRTNDPDESARREAMERAVELGGINPDVVEAGALAHDLGHPPFGHVAEKVLNTRSEKEGLAEGFNGNAQSFRIVTRLALRRETFEGLNLTRATLNAVLKYPCLRQTSGDCRDKWGAYASEQDDFEWAREMFDAAKAPRSAEADIVDWADDVAYAVHDLEDFYRAGLIPLDRLRESGGTNDEAEECLAAIQEHFREEKRGSFPATDLEKAFRRLIGSLPFTEPYQSRRRQRAAVRSMTASFVSRYINGLSLEAATQPGMRLRREPVLDLEVSVLKRLTWHYVIYNPSLATQQIGHERIINDLFDVFADAATNPKRWLLFPWGYRERLISIASGELSEEPLRIAVDYIASMTEQQAFDMHRRILGANPGSALDPIVF